jgi:hypothetical protein
MGKLLLLAILSVGGVAAQTSITHGAGAPSAGNCNTVQKYGREYMDITPTPPDLYLCGSAGWQKLASGASPAGSAGCVQLYATSSMFGNGCAAGTGALIGNPAVVIGPELVTNGGFVSGTTGWTLDADVTYGTNNVVCVYVNLACRLSQSTIATVSGNWYQLQFTVSAATGPLTPHFTHNQSPSVNFQTPYGNGVWTLVFQASYTGTDTIKFEDYNDFAGDGWTLTGISMKQVSPVASPLTLTGPEGQIDLAIDGNLLNSSLGTGALSSNTTGTFNTAMGYFALDANTSGANNTALGYDALGGNTTGVYNTALGDGALALNTTGGFNVASGEFALYYNTTGQYNVASGAYSIQFNSTGDYNVASGYGAIGARTIGTGNTAYGAYAFGNGNTIGDYNVAIGYLAGSYETGSNSFYVDNQDRTDTAGDKAGALLYGTFNATPSMQTLVANAAFSTLVSTTNPLYKTTTNCADSAGAAACGSAAAGRFVADAAATSVVVSTTAVTANSEIFIEYDSSLSTALSVTCNATIPSAYAVTARTAGTSFTLSTTANVANPGCFSYHVVN